MAFIILSIVLAIACAVVVVAIMFQESKSYGLSASIAGGSENTYWSRNKGRSKEGRLVRITVIAGIVFFVVSIILNIGAIKG